MANIKVTRKKNDREPVAITATFPDTYDLNVATIRFWMDDAATGAAKIEGAAADLEDVTPVGATDMTVWRMTYEFDADDLDTAGVYLAEFEADFGGGQYRYYPRGADMIQITVKGHPASN